LAILLVVACGGDPIPPTPTPSTPAPTPTPKPNVIFVLADDLDAASIASMPHLQGLLVQQGVSFRNALASNPICAPSRTSLLTGLQAHNHGVWRNATGAATLRASGREQSTVAVRLQQAGYRTALIGKYVNGYNGEDPAPGWDQWQAVYSSVGSDAYYNYTIRENTRAVNYGAAPSDYLTDVLSQRAVAFVRQATQENHPFFLWLAPSAPHRPATPAPRHANDFATARAPRTPSFNEQDVSDKPAYVRAMPLLTAADIDDTDALYRDRLRAMLAVDEALAAVVDAVAQAGQTGNTWFVFASDNGFMMGQHRFARGKDAPYEPSLLVPLIIRGPSTPANVARDHMVTLVDLGATLAAFGDALPADNSIDGRSLLPLLGTAPPSDSAWRTDVLLEHQMQSSGEEAVPHYAGLRTPNRVYVEYATTEVEYYELDQDPDELRSRKLDAASRAPWQERLAAVRACRGSQCP
jgi:arylsulfatase A-like enzyme